jgi:hypothetical protein
MYNSETKNCAVKDEITGCNQDDSVIQTAYTMGGMGGMGMGGNNYK